MTLTHVKESVAAWPKSDNILINGGFDIWQRLYRPGDLSYFQGSSRFMGGSYYKYYPAPDRWAFESFFDGSLEIQKHTSDGPMSASNFMRLVETGTGLPEPPWVNEAINFCQYIEGTNLKAVQTQPLSLSFWIRSSRVGNLTVSLQGGDNAASYLTLISIDQANTWEYKKIEGIPSLSIGCPSYTTYGNEIGGAVRFGLYGGSDYTIETENTWIPGFKFLLPGQTNFFEVEDTFVDFGRIQLEQGSIATPFQMRSPEIEAILCKRYAECLSSPDGTVYEPLATAQAVDAWMARGVIRYQEKRVTPTMKAQSFHDSKGTRTDGTTFSFWTIGAYELSTRGGIIQPRTTSTIYPSGVINAGETVNVYIGRDINGVFMIDAEL